MWVSPDHPDPPKPRRAPQDDGKPLLTLPRGDGNEQLRVTLKSYRGRPYLALRVWERNRAGEWWPVRGKGISLRMSEAGRVAEALGRLTTADAEPDPPSRRTQGGG